MESSTVMKATATHLTSLFSAWVLLFSSSQPRMRLPFDRSLWSKSSRVCRSRVAFHWSFLFLASKTKISRGVACAAMFSASHKSLTIGMPLLMALGLDATELGTIILPIVLYHPLQILLGTIASVRLKAWINEGKDKGARAHVRESAEKDLTSAAETMV